MKQVKERARRTQIYLSPWLAGAIENRSEKARKSKSAVIRELLTRQLAPRSKRQSFLALMEKLSRGTEKLKSPRDISVRHDYYYARDEFRRWRNRR